MQTSSLRLNVWSHSGGLLPLLMPKAKALKYLGIIYIGSLVMGRWSMMMKCQEAWRCWAGLLWGEALDSSDHFPSLAWALEMVWVLIFHVERRQLQGFSHLIRMPPEWGLPGTSNWEKTPGENFLERLCGSSSTGLPRDPPGDTRKHCRGKYLWDTWTCFHC